MFGRVRRWKPVRTAQAIAYLADMAPAAQSAARRTGVPVEVLLADALITSEGGTCPLAVRGATYFQEGWLTGASSKACKRRFFRHAAMEILGRYAELAFLDFKDFVSGILKHDNEPIPEFPGVRRGQFGVCFFDSADEADDFIEVAEAFKLCRIFGKKTRAACRT